MAENLSCTTETKNESGDLHSNESLFSRRIEFHPTTKPSPVFNNNCSGTFPLGTLNPNSNYSHKPKANAIPFSSRSQIGECFDKGLDPELSFGFTFRKIGAGLQNLGNTCFLNSVLQCLTYTEPFAAYIQSGKHKSSCQIVGFCAMCAIQNHVICALKCSGKIVAPKHLVMNLRRISRNFRYARQEDAHEYMVNLLESMHKCCLPLGFPSETPSAYEKSLVYKIFGGRLRSQVKCTECLYESNKYDPFLDLSLEIAKSSSLLKSLRHFTDLEELDGGEKQYQCQGCNKKVKATRQLTIHDAPYVLTIHFKRFGPLIPGQKIDKKVEFSPALDLKPFVTGTYEGDLKYTLYGVLVHAGWNTHSGHYYCFVRTSSGFWYVLDDNEVFQVREKTVLEQKAYMLFYVRDRRSPPKKPSNVQKKNSVVIDVSTETSNVPASSPNVTKQNGTTSLVKESNLKNPVILKSENLSIDGPRLLIDSVDSSLKKVVDVVSVPVSSKQISPVSLPIVVDLLIDRSSLLAESVDSSLKVLDASSAPNSVDNQASLVSLSNVASSNVLTGDKMEVVNELPDCNFMQEHAPKTIASDIKHENNSLVEKVDNKTPSEVSDIGSEKDNTTQLSSESSIEDATYTKACDSSTTMNSSEKISSPKIGCSPPEHDDTMLSSSQVVTEKTLFKEISDEIEKSDIMDCSVEETICIKDNNVSLEMVDSSNISSYLVSEEIICKEVTAAVETTLLSSSSNIGESICSNELIPSDSTSIQLSESQLVPDKVVNVEDNDAKLEESRNKSNHQKVVKLIKKSQVASVNFRSSMFQASLRVHKNKKKRNKRKRKRNSDDYLPGFEPSTSEKVTMESFASSCSQKQCKKSKLNNKYAKDSEDAFFETSPSLTANREPDKSSVEDFMSLLTRGLEEKTVASWNKRNPYMSENLGLNNMHCVNIGYVPEDEWDVDYDRGKRKKMKRAKNGFGGSSNPFQEIATTNNNLKKVKKDQSRSWNRPFRIL